jgi:hypothetical protein
MTKSHARSGGFLFCEKNKKHPFLMQLKKKTLQEFRDIIGRDSGVLISDHQANELGISLLRLTRVAVAALARAGERKSSVHARERTSLEHSS